MTARVAAGAEFKLLGRSEVTISTATTTSFDFGTPADLNLNDLVEYAHGDRVCVVFDASTAGTTDTVSFVIQDADDNAGSFGTPATAITGGDLSGGTGTRTAFAGVVVQSDRPWLRCRVSSSGATDTFVVRCLVLAIPGVL